MKNEEIVAQIQSGNKALIGELYLNNLSYIRKVVKRYSNDDNYDDLMQESYFGIVEAVKNWKPDAGASFLSYAAYYIKAVILNYLQKNDAAIYIPSSMLEKEWMLNAFINDFSKKHGRDPTTREIYLHTDLALSQIDEVKRAIALSYKAKSIYDRVIEQAEDSEDLRIIDTIIDPVNLIDDLIDQDERRDLSEKMWNIIKSLPEDESKIIQYRYKKGKSLRDCGKDLGISGERARQIEQRALRRIRTAHRRELQPFIDDYIYSQGLKDTGLHAFRNSLESSVERAAIKLDAKLKKYEIG